MRTTMLRTGGVAAEPISLSAIEERMVSLLGGEGFAIGDKQLEINPFFNSTNNLTTDIEMLPENVNEQLIQVEIADAISCNINIQESPLSQSIIQNVDISQPINEARLSTSATESTPQPGPSWRVDIEPPLHSHTQELAEERMSREPRNDCVASTPHRRRDRASRRRLLHRSPPAQRHSQMARITEHFISIEESRVETERILAESQQAMMNVLRDLSVAFKELVTRLCRN